MPYCTQCGSPVVETDRFCRLCGAPQPVTGGGARDASSKPALSPRAASILCYIPWFGWIAALYVLASGKFREARDVRFHAYQGLYLFVAWLLVDWAIGPWLDLAPGPRLPIDRILQLLLLGIWVVMLVNTSKGKRYSLPVLGELAERSL